MKHVEGTGMPLIRHFIESILVAVDISKREGSLLSDTTCDGGQLKHNQVCLELNTIKFVQS